MLRITMLMVGIYRRARLAQDFTHRVPLNSWTSLEGTYFCDLQFAYGIYYLVTCSCSMRWQTCGCPVTCLHSHSAKQQKFYTSFLCHMLLTFHSQNLLGLCLGRAMVAQPWEQHLDRKWKVLNKQCSWLAIETCGGNSTPWLNHQVTCILTHPAASLSSPSLMRTLTVAS